MGLIWIALAFPALAAEPLELPFEVHHLTLDNGLEVFLAPMDSPGIVSVQTWVEVGSRNETAPGTTGFAHFFEHLLFYGSETIGREPREAEILRLGVEENAWTWFDDTVYHSTVASSNVDALLALEADRFQNHHLQAADVQKEAGAVMGEYRKSMSDPWSAAFDALQATAYRTHTYGHSTIGYVEDIEAMPQKLDLARSFYDTWYRPEHVRLVVVGDFDRAQVEARIQELYGPWATGPGASAPKAERAQKSARRTTVEWDKGPANPMLMMAWRVPAHDPRSSDSAGVSALSELLSGKIGPLHRRLVDEEKLAFSLWSSNAQLVDPGLMVLGVQLAPGADVARAEAIIREEIRALSTAVDPQALARVQDGIVRSALLSWDNPTNVAQTIGSHTRVHSDPADIQGWYRGIQALTPAQVQDLAARLFVDASLTVTVLTPAESSP